MIITLAGHVDHGKTSLVHALTGVDTDRLAEEKRRGLTIDLGFAYADFGSTRVGFVDVPGHQRFVHNMVAGVAAGQTALIAIAADDGVMPQTREHLAILELIGVQKAIVAVTKADRVDADRLTEAVAEADALVATSSIERVATIVTSVATGTGIGALRTAIESLVTTTPLQQGLGFRLAVDRSFNVRGAGLVVTGTVHSGSVRDGDELVIAPIGTPVRARSIRVQDRPATQAQVGDRCAINLAGADLAAVARGDWIVAPSAFCPTRTIALQLRVAKDRPRPVRHWLRIHAYHATSHSEGHIALLDTPPLGAGSAGLVELVLDEPFNPKHGDPIIIRDHGMDATLGGGKVVDIAGPMRHRRAAARLSMLKAQQTDIAEQALANMLNLDAIEPAHLQANRNLSDAALAALFDDQHMVRVHREGRTFWESIERWRAWTADVVDRVGAYHKAAPHSPGLKRDQLRHVTTVPARWLDVVVAQLIGNGGIKEVGGHFCLPTHRAKLPDADARLLKRIEQALTGTDQPPSTGDLAKLLGVDLASIRTFIARMAAEGLLVRVSDKRVFLPAFVSRMSGIAIALGKKTPAGFSAKDFRDASGIGRNLVIDLLEYFDDRSFTRRYGDLRRIVGDPSRL